MPVTHFFAARNEIQDGIRRAESSLPVHYVIPENREDTQFTCYSSLLDDPNCGVSLSGDEGDPRLLVLPVGSTPKWEVIPRVGKPPRYHLSAPANPDGFTLSPGGSFEEKAIVLGFAWIDSKTSPGYPLWKQYLALLTKGFRRVKSYKVSPGAMEGAKLGLRLVVRTIHDDPKYDLVV